MIRVKVSNNSVISALRGVREGLLVTAVKAVRQDVVKIAEVMMPTVPTDTHRLYNGWATAFNRAKAGPVAVRTIKPSRFKDRRTAALRKQMKWFNDLILIKKREIVREGSSRGRTRAIDKLIKARDRALEEYNRYAASNGTAVVMINNDRLVERTVRDKVYGGEGFYTVRNGGKGVSAVLRNLEPHALISNRFGPRAGYVDRAVAAVGQRFAAPRRHTFQLLNAMSRNRRTAAYRAGL